MKLLLICETNIIKDIFALICKKLNVELIVQSKFENSNNTKFDFIVIDQNFIDDKFNNFKQSCKKLGAISSEELPFDKSRDFLIPRPFLPTKLEYILLDEIENLKLEEKRDFKKNNLNYEDEYLEDTEVTIPVIDYMETLVDDLYNDLEEENDESIISLASIKNGGVLDRNELSKINNILFESLKQEEIDINDWKDITEIIDDALNEVKDYEFEYNDKKFHLILNNYKIEELRPLLNKLNQNLIDSLANGEEVDITLKLKKD